MLKIGLLIYTFDRVDDAKINMELVHSLWQSSKHFSQIKIVHAYNGEEQWYPEQYLEDDLIRIKNSGHFQGAAELIDAGLAVFQEKYSDLDYVIVIAADTWLIKPDYFSNIIQYMNNDRKYLATCSWGNPENNNIFETGMAVDLFILDLQWVIKYEMFPIDYKGFIEKYWDLVLYNTFYNVMLEKLLLSKFVKAVYREESDNAALKFLAKSKIYKLADREPVHIGRDENGFLIRKMDWPKMGLLTHHDPEQKKIALASVENIKGDNITKLLTSNNLDYYNIGVRRQKAVSSK